MPELKMPALSPTMEKGTLAKWLVGVGDTIRAGDLIAEIETDKATMELEADEEGQVASLVVAEGTDGVPVGTVIAVLAGEGEAVGAPAPRHPEQRKEPAFDAVPESEATGGDESPKPASTEAPRARLSDRIKVSPLAARIAEAKGIVLDGIAGSGPNGRIVRADLGLPAPVVAPSAPAGVSTAPALVIHPVPDVPHELLKLSNMRKTIARRLTESKQQVPHIYLSVDVRLDALLKLREQLNEALEPRGLKLSVNDMVIKALALSLLDVPQCNVQFTGDSIAQFQRADISVAVSIPGGLITPIITDAGGKTLSAIASEMKDLAGRARDGKLRPEEYQGGTASLSNLGMYGIKQFEAVINPPQAMIMAVGAGERRHVVNDDDTAAIATVMTATGSFDHRAIDGVDAAQLMQAFKRRIENPLQMIA